MDTKHIPERWQVAETYPIEGFWQTQIVLRGAEVVATTAGRTEEQSRKRAEQIVAAEEAALSEADKTIKMHEAAIWTLRFVQAGSATVADLEQQVTQQAATIDQLEGALKRIASDFECDYVLDGFVVDDPPKVWVMAYNVARAALASIPKERP